MSGLNDLPGGNGRARVELGLPGVPQAQPTESERQAADRVLARYPLFTRDQLLPLLRDVQAETGWLSKELTRYLSQRLQIPYADLYGVMSFYALLTTRPAARTMIRVCRGVVCQLRGARELGRRMAELTGAEAGEPAADGEVKWEWFACIGQCDHAPALLVGEEAERDVTPERLEAIVKEAGHGGA
jgi:NADH-quinone oxidoreductase subunit E